MRKPKISPELVSFLKSGQGHAFTIAELKSAYMAMPTCPYRSDKAAWQFVQRTVARMEGHGLVKRLVVPIGDKVRYQWSQSEEVSVATENNPPNEATISCLKEKLNRYKVEMLSAIGETEEYDAICAELPHMRSAVQAHYNDARDRCSKILGRVRALESILSQQFQWKQTT